MTHYLRFPDEATAITVLAAYRTKDDTWITASHDHALDVIGTITIGGEYDEEGNVVVAPTVLDGWHVNFMGELPEDWADYVVNPEQPVRVFAGGGGPAPTPSLTRARNELGQFVGDDPATPAVDEAWVEANA